MFNGMLPEDCSKRNLGFRTFSPCPEGLRLKDGLLPDRQIRQADSGGRWQTHSNHVTQLVVTSPSICRPWPESCPKSNFSHLNLPALSPASLPLYMSSLPVRKQSAEGAPIILALSVRSFGAFGSVSDPTEPT